MKLFKLTVTPSEAYDYYDHAIVVAESEEQARTIHPNGKAYWDGNNWVQKDYQGNLRTLSNDSWAHAQEVEVSLIGEAAPHLEKGVVLASFNAG